MPRVKKKQDTNLYSKMGYHWSLLIYFSSFSTEIIIIANFLGYFEEWDTLFRHLITLVRQRCGEVVVT